MGISVFVIDAERTFADALSAWLEAEDDVDVVMPVHHRAPAPSMIVGRHADVVLLDADLPYRAAIALCEELCGRDDGPRVVMVSRGCEVEAIADAIRAGAAGWVCKDEPIEHLLSAIRGAAAGKPGCRRARPVPCCGCFSRSASRSVKASVCSPP